jgi:Glycosyltransferases, probably involved in cell wall biogenesis
MQAFLTALFWAGLTIVGYTYVGYGILIYILSKSKTKPAFSSPPDAQLPEVSLVVAAYNEEDFIRQKVRNSLELNYPKDKLQLIFVTDGSTDHTSEIVKEYPAIRLFHERERRGKIHAVNRVMKEITTPITVFCDANTYLNPDAIRNLVRHFADPSVGGVAGEKKIVSKESDNASGAGEGLYWKYESFLKRKDAEVHSVVGAAGELFAIRTNLYEPPPPDMIIEDFYLSLRVAAKGFRFAYEPDAFARETASASVEEEWKRKVRICAGGFQAMARLVYLLNPFRYGILSFQYISHRVLRWTLAPLSLLVILISNLYLALTGYPLYQALLILQLGFYVIAIAGWVMRNRKVNIKGFFVPYYFSVMNAAVYAGFIRYVRNRQSVVWDRAKRAELT